MDGICITGIEVNDARSNLDALGKLLKRLNVLGGVFGSLTAAVTNLFGLEGLAGTFLSNFAAHVAASLGENLGRASCLNFDELNRLREALEEAYLETVLDVVDSRGKLGRLLCGEDSRLPTCVSVEGLQPARVPEAAEAWRAAARVVDEAAKLLAGQREPLIVRGPSGSGKSMLLLAVASKLIDDGIAVCRVRCLGCIQYVAQRENRSLLSKLGELAEKKNCIIVFDVDSPIHLAPSESAWREYRAAEMLVKNILWNEGKAGVLIAVHDSILRLVETKVMVRMNAEAGSRVKPPSIVTPRVENPAPVIESIAASVGLRLPASKINEIASLIRLKDGLYNFYFAYWLLSSCKNSGGVCDVNSGGGLAAYIAGMLSSRHRPAMPRGCQGCDEYLPLTLALTPLAGYVLFSRFNKLSLDELAGLHREIYKRLKERFKCLSYIEDEYINEIVNYIAYNLLTEDGRRFRSDALLEAIYEIISGKEGSPLSKCSSALLNYPRLPREGGSLQLPPDYSFDSNRQVGSQLLRFYTGCLKHCSLEGDWKEYLESVVESLALSLLYDTLLWEQEIDRMLTLVDNLNTLVERSLGKSLIDVSIELSDKVLDAATPLGLLFEFYPEHISKKATRSQELASLYYHTSRALHCTTRSCVDEVKRIIESSKQRCLGEGNLAWCGAAAYAAGYFPTAVADAYGKDGVSQLAEQLAADMSPFSLWALAKMAINFPREVAEALQRRCGDLGRLLASKSIAHLWAAAQLQRRLVNLCSGLDAASSLSVGGGGDWRSLWILSRIERSAQRNAANTLLKTLARLGKDKMPYPLLRAYGFIASEYSPMLKENPKLAVIVAEKLLHYTRSEGRSDALYALARIVLAGVELGALDAHSEAVAKYFTEAVEAAFIDYAERHGAWKDVYLVANALEAVEQSIVDLSSEQREKARRLRRELAERTRTSLARYQKDYSVPKCVTAFLHGGELADCLSLALKDHDYDGLYISAFMCIRDKCKKPPAKQSLQLLQELSKDSLQSRRPRMLWTLAAACYSIDPRNCVKQGVLTSDHCKAISEAIQKGAKYLSFYKKEICDKFHNYNSG